jgi:hypothetical protein
VVCVCVCSQECFIADSLFTWPKVLSFRCFFVQVSSSGVVGERAEEGHIVMRLS